MEPQFLVVVALIVMLGVVLGFTAITVMGHAIVMIVKNIRTVYSVYLEVFAQCSWNVLRKLIRSPHLFLQARKLYINLLRLLLGTQ